jgi:hypothetical protein
LSKGRPHRAAETAAVCATSESLYYRIDQQAAMAVDPNYRTLRCRFKELFAAAGSEIDEDSKALFLFYAVECGLKALYLQLHRPATTSTAGSSARSARSFGHRLDDLIVALRIAASTVPPRPTQLALRNGTVIAHPLAMPDGWPRGPGQP